MIPYHKIITVYNITRCKKGNLYMLALEPFLSYPSSALEESQVSRWSFSAIQRTNFSCYVELGRCGIAIAT